MTDISPEAAQSPQPPVAQPRPAEAETNVYAILSLIGAFIFVGIPGIIFGHMALRSIAKTGESGRGMALAGTIIGYVSLGFTILAVIVIMIFIVAVASTQNSIYFQYS